MIEIKLPWPPSVNHYWRNYRGRTVVSQDGRLYRQTVSYRILEQGIPRENIRSRLSVSIDAYPPDKRRRDLDNITKALLDAIVAADVIEDDSQIDSLSILRHDAKGDGEVIVRIKEYGPVQNLRSRIQEPL